MGISRRKKVKRKKGKKEERIEFIITFYTADRLGLFTLHPQTQLWMPIMHHR
jgi:hypothetical protein